MRVPNLSKEEEENILIAGNHTASASLSLSLGIHSKDKEKRAAKEKEKEGQENRLHRAMALLERLPQLRPPLDHDPPLLLGRRHHNLGRFTLPVKFAHSPRHPSVPPHNVHHLGWPLPPPIPPQCRKPV